MTRIICIFRDRVYVSIMKSFLPIYIAIITVVLVMFITKNQGNWQDSSPQQKRRIVLLLAGGIVVLIGILVGYLFAAE